MAEQLPISTASNQQYGQRLAQQRAQEAVPMAQSPTTVPSPVRERPQPAPAGSFVASTTRPNEPITAGASFGPGMGPVAAGIPMLPPSADNVMEELKAIYQRFPNGDLADLIDSTLREGY